MNLIHSENISSDFVYPNGNDVNVNVIFKYGLNYIKIKK